MITNPITSFTLAELNDVLAKEPDLTSHGFGICHRRGRLPLETEHETYRARAELYDRIEVIAAAVEWLRPRPKLKHVNRYSHSYALKHECEREIEQYVSNGELLVAVIHLSFGYEAAHGVNANTNVGKLNRPARQLEAV